MTILTTQSVWVGPTVLYSNVNGSGLLQFTYSKSMLCTEIFRNKKTWQI